MSTILSLVVSCQHWLCPVLFVGGHFRCAGRVGPITRGTCLLACALARSSVLLLPFKWTTADLADGRHRTAPRGLTVEGESFVQSPDRLAARAAAGPSSKVRVSPS